MLSWASAATAQTSSARPFRGLFGSDAGDSGHALTVSATAGAAVDVGVTRNRVGGPLATTREGVYALSTQGLTYGLQRGAVSFATAASATARYYAVGSEPMVAGYSAMAALSMPVSRRTHLSGGYRLSYQPYFIQSFVRGVAFDGDDEGDALAQAFPLTQEHVMSSGAYVAVQQSVSRRTGLHAGYGYRRSHADGSQRQQRGTHANAGLTWGIGKGLALRAGYDYSVARYGSGDDEQQLAGHQVDAGVDFSRQLTISRHTTVSFQAGSSAVTTPARTRYGLVGNARLNRQLGRSWNAGVAYSRNVRYVESFDEPVFADSVVGSLTGLFSNRLQFDSALIASRAAIGVGDQSRFDRVTGSAALTVGLTRHLGLGVSYGYYRHAFEASSAAGFLTPQHRRQTVRAFVSAWAPLYRSKGTR